MSLGDAAFRMSIFHWVNAGLLTVCAVGLEVKHEMTVGHLVSRRSADLRRKIIGELAKDFSRRSLKDIASLIADA